ncbi:MAG: hypothetical protein IJ639_05300 [Ruminococcus sp.]|nr:hypothetical protein [Ruminococcus sp.]
MDAIGMIDDELIDDAAPGRNNRIVGAVFRLTSMHRQLIAAASIVLVVLAGISVYFFFGNKNIPVRPSGSQNGPITVDTTVPKETSSAEPSGSANTEPQSEHPTGTAAPSATINASSATQPTVITPSGTPVTEPSATAPSGAPATEPDNQQTETSGTPSPTSTAHSATEQLAPTERATQKPAEPPTLPYEMGTDPPEDPYTPPSDSAGESPMPGDPGSAVIYSSVSSSLLTGHKHVYCVLYHRVGNRVDSEPILSPKHETIPSIGKDGYAYFAYSPPEEWNLSTGMYNMEIYNENGKMIQREIVFLNYE